MSLSLMTVFYWLSLMTVFFLGVVYQFLEMERRFKILAARSKPPSIDLAVLRRYTETPLFSPRRPATPPEMPVAIPWGGYLLMIAVAVAVPFGVLVAIGLGLAIGYLAFRIDWHDIEGAFSLGHRPVAQHHPRDPLPPPKFLENKVAVQSDEMLRIARENQRLKETNVALRQELFASHAQVTESNIQNRGLIEKIRKTEAGIERQSLNIGRRSVFEPKTYNNWDEKYISLLQRPSSKWNENQLGHAPRTLVCPPRRIGCCVQFSTKGKRRW